MRSGEGRLRAERSETGGKKCAEEREAFGGKVAKQRRSRPQGPAFVARAAKNAQGEEPASQRFVGKIDGWLFYYGKRGRERRETA